MNQFNLHFLFKYSPHSPNLSHCYDTFRMLIIEIIIKTLKNQQKTNEISKHT